MRWGFLILLLVSYAAGADAAQVCYLANEVEADQAVQFQTELMVVSNACKTPIYTKFTERNRSAIVDYQHELIAHFRRSGERHAETVFETYLTHLANESALRANEQPPAALCAQAADWLRAADITGPDEFRRLAALRAATSSPAYRRCGG
jgi:hypothetical protein